MLIRSQNKMSLVKFENIVININNINGKEIICWSQMNPGEDEYISLGHYSAKAKAMKVLDMIQEAYADAALIPMAVPNIGKMFAEASASKENELLAEAIGKALTNKMVFQMPEDSEVEV
jgi:hypothetical protein|nr:MAG TPA: hypothetical protein [Caudoviricetes sp.]